MNNSNRKILANALYDNYEKFADEKGKAHATIQNSYALDKYLTGNGAEGFSRQNGARAGIKGLSRDEIAELFASVLYRKAREDVAENDFEKEVFFKIGMQEMFGAKKEDIIKNMVDCMTGQSKEAYGLSSRLMMDFVVKEYEKKIFPQIEQERRELAENIEKDVDPKYKVSKLNVNTPAINYCRQEVLCGTQISLQNDTKARDPERRPRREYNVDDVMLAVTDIGNKRKEQQDAVTILYHPSSKAYKMLAVADGMGGVEHGEKASQEIIRQMTIWFESLDPEYLKEGKEAELADMWDNKLMEINQDIIEAYPGSGSTFVGAIVGEKSTIVASVGDSRAYVVANDDELYQVTSDDNVNFKKWEKEMQKDEFAALEKDMLRFRKDSNQITAAMGIARMPKPVIQFKRFLNTAYKTLMLFSDGVTDCLTDRQIMAINKNTDPKDLAAALVNKALTTESIRPSMTDNPDYVARIQGGKDNTTAAVYHNTDGEER